MSDADRPDITVLPDPPPPGRPRVKKLRLLLLLGGLGLLAAVSTIFGMMMAVASDLPALETREEFNSAQNSILTDAHGQYLATLADQGRIIVEAQDIAMPMQQAIIAVEDERFYENSGVDLRGIGRAFWQDVVAGGAVQGGSTITQQFVKNATQSQAKRTMLEKLREAALAYHLTRKWSKSKILTQYLNSIYFGNGAYGIEAAARTYFGSTPLHAGCGAVKRRCAAELRPHEAALIAGVVASPSRFDPVSNRAAAKRRRDLVLDKMLEQRYLTAGAHARAVAQPLPSPLQIQPPRDRSVTRSSAYFTSWVRQQIIDRYGARRALEGGLRVQTTLDLGLQRSAEDAVQKWLPNPTGPTASLVAIDNRTGEVRAMVGGRDYDRVPFNLATQGQRQPGSAFKPFVLATALRRGISPASTWVSKKQIIDVPDSPEQFVVNNYEGNYAGVSTLARATTFSDNAVYAQVGIKAGTKRIARTARRMGIRTPVSSNYAITLGGLEQGVTPLDMAHAYETFATGGELVTGTLASRRGPVGIRRVTLRDQRDKVVDRNRARRVPVLPRGVAETTKSLLASVIKIGTARVANLGEVPAWGKTGTTENYGDAWFVGSTDRLTVAVWVGYPDRLKPMETEYRGEPVAGGTYPAQIWHDFMLAAVQADQSRVEKECAAVAEKDPEATPTTRCVEAGFAPDPTAPAPEAPAPQKTPTTGDATPQEDAGTGGAGTGGGGTGDGTGGGATPAPAPAPAPETPPAPAPAPPAAPPPAPAPAPAPPADAGGAAPPPG